MAITDSDQAKPVTKIGTQNSKTDKKKTGKDEIVINPDAPENMAEAKGKTLVMAWGRMNPPTVGHEKLVQKVISVARQVGGEPHIMVTQTQDPKKNPLDYDEKLKLVKQAFGRIVHGPTRDKTLIDVMKSHQQGYDNIVMVAGSDRVQEYETLLNKYNGKDYKYDSIKVVSAGERDPDADGAEGMSASKMRAAAAANDMVSFTRGLPNKLKRDAKKIFDMVRAGMKLAEELEEEGLLELDEAVLNIAQRRKRAQIMRRFKTKIKRAREIAKKRMARETQLRKRSQRLARKLVRKRVAGQRGINYQKLSPGDKMAVDKMVERKKDLIARLAKRLYPRVKQAELKRLVKARQGQAHDNKGHEIKHFSSQTENFDQEYAAMLIEQMRDFELNELFDTLYEAEAEDKAKIVSKERKEKDLEDSDLKTKTHKMQEDWNYIAEIFDSVEDRLLNELKSYQEDAVADTREKHKQEKERLKARHDREMDRARLTQARADNKETKIESLVKKSETSGIDYDILETVYHRGLNSYTGNAAKQTAEQFAFARVNSYINKGKTYYNDDKDLHEMEIDPKMKQRIEAARARLEEQLQEERKKLAECKYRHETVSIVARMADINNKLENIEEDYTSYDPNKVAEFFFEAQGDAQDKRYKLRRLAKMGLVDPQEYPKFDIIMGKLARSDGNTDKLTQKERGFLSKIYDKLTDVIAADPTVFQKYKQQLRKMGKEVEEQIEEGGLWDNIHAKRKRIKAGSGEKMRKPGSKGAPTAQDFKDAAED